MHSNAHPGVQTPPYIARLPLGAVAACAVGCLGIGIAVDPLLAAGLFAAGGLVAGKIFDFRNPFFWPLQSEHLTLKERVNSADYEPFASDVIGWQFRGVSSSTMSDKEAAAFIDRISTCVRILGPAANVWMTAEQCGKPLQEAWNDGGIEALSIVGSERRKLNLNELPIRIFLSCPDDLEVAADELANTLRGCGFQLDELDELEFPTWEIDNDESAIDGTPVHVIAVSTIIRDHPKMIAGLDKIAGPYRLTTSFALRPAAHVLARGEFMRAASGGLRPTSNQASIRIKALEEYEADAMTSGHATLKVTAVTPCEKTARQIRAAFAAEHILTQPIDNPLGCILGTIPGLPQYGRASLSVVTRTAVSMAPFTLSQGDSGDGVLIGKRMNGTAKRLTYHTINKQPEESDHTFLCGRSGSGKSFTAGYLCAAYLASSPSSRVYIVDHGRSSLAFVKACRGDFHYDRTMTDNRLQAWEGVADIFGDIAARLDGTPTMIFIDEVQRFECSELEELFADARKLNAALMVATPMPEHVIGTNLGAAIRQQCVNRFWSANPGIDSNVCRFFNLDEHAENIIRTAQPKRDVLHQTNQSVDVFQPIVTPALHAMIGSATPEHKAAIDAGTDPLEWMRDA